MNKLTIIGNLVKDPELRTTQSGINVCNFTVAVNRRVKQGEEQKADFVKVTVWRQLGEICAKYLAKGRKVCVVGSASASAFTAKNGDVVAMLELLADDVEFLSTKGEQNGGHTENIDPQSGYTAVETDDLPF